VGVKTEARWLYVPGVSDRDLGPSHLSGIKLTDEEREKAAEIRRRRAGCETDGEQAARR
jgi:hypothetical protein